MNIWIKDSVFFAHTKPIGLKAGRQSYINNIEKMKKIENKEYLNAKEQQSLGKDFKDKTVHKVNEKSSNHRDDEKSLV